MYQSTSVLIVAALSLFNPAAAFPAPPWAKFNLFGSDATATLPQGSAPLQQPTTQLQLIALGVGTQNYTCASTTATPKAIGAAADLFDATAFVSNSGKFANGKFADVANSQMTHFADKSSTDSYNNGLGLPQVGKHFFDAAGVPNFDLSGKNKYLYAKKISAVPAPSDAFAGRDGQAAVAWLYLVDDGTGRSNGVGSVYRVETVGGSAPSCDGTAPADFITHDYSAQYWFYE